MADKKIEKLIEQLYRRTVERKIQWQKTADENVFLTAFPDYSMRILYRQRYHPLLEMSKMLAHDYAPEITYILQIYDDAGDLIDEIKDNSLEQESAEKLREIYKIARRNAMGVDKAIDKLLYELSERVA